MRFAAAMLTTLALAPTVYAQPTLVIIENFAFTPEDVSVEAGDIVRWENHDSIHHTATSQTGAGTLVPSGVFDSNMMGQGDAFEHRFDEPGVYYYFCVPHGSSMQGIVRVLPRCPADFNRDGGVDGSDVEAFFVRWEAGESNADVNLDGGVDGADVEAFIVVWQAGGC